MFALLLSVSVGYPAPSPISQSFVPTETEIVGVWDMYWYGARDAGGSCEAPTQRGAFFQDGTYISNHGSCGTVGRWKIVNGELSLTEAHLRVEWDEECFQWSVVEGSVSLFRIVVAKQNANEVRGFHWSWLPSSAARFTMRRVQ